MPFCIPKAEREKKNWKNRFIHAKMEVYSFQLSSQIWNLLPLGKAVQQPAPGRTHLRIHSASNSVIPSTNSDCLPCARKRENGSEQSSHITGLLGSSSELEKWAVEFLVRTTDLGSTLGAVTTPGPHRHTLEWKPHPLPRGSWSWLHHVEQLALRRLQLWVTLGTG